MVEVKETRIHRIPAQHGVDPIDVFIDWYGEDKSQVTLRCWNQAWTYYWGAHGHKDVEHFLVETGADYKANCFTRATGQKQREVMWLEKIFHSLEAFLKERGFGGVKKDG